MQFEYEVIATPTRPTGILTRWSQNFARNEAVVRRCALNLIKKFQEISNYRMGKAKMALKTIRKLLVVSDNNMAVLLQGTKGVT
ncbi:MAG: hypothetical protein LBL17_03800 [Coxiellaceae bacterium]|jgi:hypothetical protein|nr:hypothetical protein [Coxiellaceae bacterium]